MNSSDLINVFIDTQTRIASSETLRLATEESRAKSRVYDAGFTSEGKTVKSESLNISVLEGRSFDTARRFTDGRVAVLNFANPIKPGGGVRGGVKAQEECLCRCSNLYDVISSEELQAPYYEWHKSNNSYSYSDKLIYSPDIKIIKDDDYGLLDAPFSVDVITCAAPYSVYGYERESLRATLVSRITNILEAAADNDVDTVVLGAFGCGVFRNPPDLVAECFKEVLVTNGYYRYFKRVVFAIVNASIFDRNFGIFEQTLGHL